MKKVFNIVLLLIIMSSCSSSKIVVLKNIKIDNSTKSDECVWLKDLNKNAIKTLKKRVFENFSENTISIKVIQKGVRNNCILELNCNGAFQAPRFLGFYTDDQLLIFVDNYNLDIIYQKFNTFFEANKDSIEFKMEVWDQIENLISDELLNKYNKIPTF